MAYTLTDPTVYMVGWEEHNVVKVGYSTRQRWKPFVARGGVVMMLEAYPTTTEAFDREDHLHGIMREIYPQAFTEKAQAKALLGSGGSGFLECYVADVTQARRFFNG